MPGIPTRVVRPNALLKHFGVLFMPLFYDPGYFYIYKLMFKMLKTDVQVEIMIHINILYKGIRDSQKGILDRHVT